MVSVVMEGGQTMKRKNKEIIVNGMEFDGNQLRLKKLTCICSNDEHGKTLSIDNGVQQFTIPFEAVEHCFKGDYRKK